jgi:antitoxin VapB
MMQTIKVVMNKDTQSIQLPKEYWVSGKEMFVSKIGNSIVLLSKKNPWELFEKSLIEFSTDFFAEGRQQPKIQNIRKSNVFA